MQSIDASQSKLNQVRQTIDKVSDEAFPFLVGSQFVDAALRCLASLFTLTK